VGFFRRSKREKGIDVGVLPGAGGGGGGGNLKRSTSALPLKGLKDLISFQMSLLAAKFWVAANMLLASYRGPGVF